MKSRSGFFEPDDLSALLKEKVGTSGLTLKTAKLLGMSAISGEEVAKLKLWGSDELPALKITYIDPLNQKPIIDKGKPFARFRCLREPANKPKKFAKYMQPKGSGVHVYFPRLPQIDWQEILKDPSHDIIITEGELKAAKSCFERFPAIGLGGVDSFTTDGALLPDLSVITWQGRKVFVAYDSDAATKLRVAAAEQRLARELTALGAQVFGVALPSGPEGAKCGLDDLLSQPNGKALLSALLADAKPLKPVDPTEDGVALEFVSRNKDTLQYCHTTGAWFVWNGVVWRRDETKIVFSMVRDTCREIGSAAGISKAQKERLGKASTMTAVERLAMTANSVGVTSAIWDANPFLLGTPGGTIDLKSGEQYDAKSQDFITKLVAVAPADKAECPLWLKFLKEATGDDHEVIRFLQQWAGYTLTGDTREHQLLLIYGPGGNGKSVFINVLSCILNEYSRTAAMDTFTASRHDKHPTEVAWLKGARLVTASETEDSHTWAEAKLKQMTGGDVISARFMNKDFFEFLPTFKLTIVGNHKPELKNIDDAAKRRFNVVPFNHKPSKPDKELEHKFRAELPGILRWMIEGCLDWQRNGLVRPKVVTKATEDYFSAQDSFGSWVSDCCVKVDDAKERPRALLTNFNLWAGRNSEKTVDRKKFHSWVERQEGLIYKTINGANYVAGIRLLTDAELNPKELEPNRENPEPKQENQKF